MIDRDLQHPMPLGNQRLAYLSDGVYVSHDGASIWVSCDREDGLHAIALDVHALRELVRYARAGGWSVP